MIVKDIFTKLFKRQPENVRTITRNKPPRRYDCRKALWGHHLSIGDFIGGEKKGTIYKCYGHLTPSVSVGDEVIISMDSGRDCVFTFLEVNNCSDPTDMFFAEIGAIGYLDEGI